MLGSLLQQEEEYLETACTDSSENIEQQSQALKELWLLHQSLSKPND